MNRKIAEEPKFYKHQQLMDELNDFIITVKIHSGVINQDAQTMDKLKRHHPMPSNDAINILHNKINEVLRQESYPFRKY